MMRLVGCGGQPISSAKRNPSGWLGPGIGYNHRHCTVKTDTCHIGHARQFLLVPEVLRIIQPWNGSALAHGVDHQSAASLKVSQSMTIRSTRTPAPVTRQICSRRSSRRFLRSWPCTASSLRGASPVCPAPSSRPPLCPLQPHRRRTRG